MARLRAGLSGSGELRGHRFDARRDLFAQHGIRQRVRRTRVGGSLECRSRIAQRAQSERSARAAGAVCEMPDLIEAGAVAILEARKSLPHQREVAGRAGDELLCEFVEPRLHGGIAARARFAQCASHSALTCLPRVMGSNGLAMIPIEDNSRRRPVSLALTLAVMKMTGMRERSGSERILRSRLGPSMPGIITSSTTRSGFSTFIFSSARSPPSLVCTWRSPSR